MAITYVDGVSNTDSNTTSVTLTLPATQAGDIIILEFAHKSTGDGAVSGTSISVGGLTFTLKHSQYIYSTSRVGGMYWARATGNHSGQTVIISSLNNGCTACITIYRGAISTGDPLAGATIVGELNGSGDETQAEIVTTVDNCLICFTVANSVNQYAVSNQRCTDPGTLGDTVISYAASIAIEHASSNTLKATAGGTGAFLWSQTNAISGSWAYAILPEPPAPSAQAGFLLSMV